VRFFYIAVLSLLLSGCEVLEQLEVIPPQNPPQTASGTQQAHQLQLSKLNQWNLNGRLSIRQGDEAWHASIRWAQTEDAYAIDIVGPLGQGALNLTGGTQQVVLRTSKNEVFVARTPEALLKEHLGWQVPVQGLRYWALGRIDPQLQYESENDQLGRFNTLQQSGWDIRYKRYQTAQGIDLPGKVFMKRADLDIRLIIDNWQTGEPDKKG